MIATLAGIGTSGSAAEAATSPLLMPAAGQFVPITPVTVLDTRYGTGGVAAAPVAAGATVTFPVTGVGSIPATGVSDVFEEISGLNVTGSGALEAYNADDSSASWTVPVTTGQNSTVADMTQVSQGGYVSITNAATSGSADIVVRVMGYVQTADATTAGDTYVALADHGVLDTQTGLGDPNGIAEIPSGGSVTFGVLGQGVPSDAAGAAIYLGTAADATTAGYLSVYAAGTTDPNTRVVDYQPGHVVHNLYFGAISSPGQLTVTNHGSAPVDVKAAVQGYLVSPTASEAGDTYTSVNQARIVDTRTGLGGVATQPIPANGSITFSAAGADGIPTSGVSAIAESVAAINPAATGYLTSYPAGTTDPNNAAVNFNGSDTQDNDLTTPLVSSVSPTGEETITNHSTGTVDVVVTAKGYYSNPSVSDEPSQADAGLDGSGNLTVDWQAPDTDGGAAITGYQVTVYNSDGSVNQTGTHDPGTTTATITGLNPTTAYTVGIVAVNAVGSSSSATAPANSIPSGYTAPSSEAGSIGTDMAIDPSTGDLTLESVTGDTSTSTQDGTETGNTPDTNVSPSSNVYPSNGLGNYSCVIKANDGIVAHTPWHNYGSWSNGTIDFAYFEYTKNNARTLSNGHGSYKTFQNMLCATGGGEGSGDQHMWFAGSSMTLTQSKEYKIGQNWGHGTSNGSVSTTLNFQLQGGVASIGASVPVTTGVGSYAGDIGSDSRYIDYPYSPNYNPNRTNAFFVSPHRWPWDGTDSYEGNTSENLAEWPMGASGKYHWNTDAVLQTFCASPVGIC